MADVVEAMLPHCLYHLAQRIEYPLAKISRNAGTHYDPKAVEIFSAVPKGSF
jgi:HD-GYP domain-containing protein (c-di-GMP phosphodiesterase class II)